MMSKAYIKYTEMDFICMKRLFQKKGEVSPKKALIICSLPRSGSNLMCRQLVNGGVGYPIEYFNDAFIYQAMKDWNAWNTTDIKDYTRLIIKHATSENGVFSLKLHWDQFEKYIHIVENEIFSKIGNVEFVFLTRMNIKDQAISFHKSLITGIWEVGDRSTSKPVNVNPGNKNHIRKYARRIYRGELMWRCYFSEHKIDPLRIYYEDYVKDQPGYFKKIVDRLQIESSPPPPEEKSVPSKLAKLKIDVPDFCALIDRDLKPKLSWKKRLKRKIKRLRSF